ncbi:MAG: ABC transporter ATP-binding protein [Verrucomicrobia bacterium]|jgi:putative ABC transport system ATP-binding protein|nr:ABC transporter ATP-binding protein [Verrucomicrobiota bacterium]
MLICESLSKHYRSLNGEVKSLDKVDLHVNKGEFLVVRGHSGSGKTTLLLTLGAMLHPTHGRVLLNDADLYGLSRSERTKFRSRSIGFVFQMFHLVPYLNVIDNVLSGVDKTNQDSRAKAENFLQELGLGDRLHHLPNQLSAGEKQRTALARAMAPEPALILADEPTGNLDPENSLEVCTHLKKFQERGGTVIVVTHGDAVNAFADRTIDLKDGTLLSKSSCNDTEVINFDEEQSKKS